jgi:hypothetical protein
MTKNTSSIDSLIEKIHTYCKFAGAGNVPDGLRDFILSPVPREHGLGVYGDLQKKLTRGFVSCFLQLSKMG